MTQQLFKEYTDEDIQVQVLDAHLPLTTVLEGLLFVSEAAVAPSQIAKLLALDVSTIEAGLQALAQRYQTEQRGLHLLENKGKFQLTTLPAMAGLVETFLNLDANTRFSGPALETLAMIAYRQPLTRMQIEAVRGVDCAGVLRSLLQRGLVEEVGRLEIAGRPILYGITELFLQYFGLASLGELPPLATFEADT